MTEPRWLNEDEQRAWRAYLYGYRALFDALDRELQSDAGIPHTYYEILVPLSEAPDRRMRMSELADVTWSSRSRLSHAVARLEERGWIKREDVAHDRRGQMAVLTDAGWEAVVAAAPGHVSAVRRYLIDRVTPELLSSMEAVGKIALDAAHVQLPPRSR